MVDFLFQKHNSWWTDIRLIEDDLVIREFERQKFRYIHPFIDNFPQTDAVITIRGPRRIGKTTLVKLLIRKLLKEKKISPKNVFFYPCNRISDYNELFDLLLNYRGEKIKGRRYIFLDEITFVREWQRAIKDLVDEGDLAGCTLIMTGSDALDLKYSLDIEFLPLRFDQFARMTGNKIKKENLLPDYLLCGGFPQSINEYYRYGFISNYIYDTYLSWIEGDIHKAKKSEILVYQVLGEVVKHLGSTVSWYKIAKNTGIGSHTTVFDYMDVLEKIFVAFPLNFYSIDQKKIYPAKNKKIYFLDSVIFHAVMAKINNFTDQYFNYAKQTVKDGQILPKMIENIVASKLYQDKGKLYFGNFREKEVDFVIEQKGKASYFEVKYQNQIKLADFDFWNKKEKLTVITKNLELKKGNLNFIPLELFLLSENS